MKRFYIHIDIIGVDGTYQIYLGYVFSGVQFKDQEGQIVKMSKVYYEFNIRSPIKILSTEESDICGIETARSSEWIFVGGPSKGSYATKVANDWAHDYISDFGMRVEDPCQAIDNTLKINLTPSKTTVKDLKYHNGTDS